MALHKKSLEKMPMTYRALKLSSFVVGRWLDKCGWSAANYIIKTSAKCSIRAKRSTNPWTTEPLFLWLSISSTTNSSMTPLSKGRTSTLCPSWGVSTTSGGRTTLTCSCSMTALAMSKAESTSPLGRCLLLPKELPTRTSTGTTSLWS